MKQKKLKAWLGKQSVKNKFLKRVQEHYDADEIIQGIYWENGKGCAIGCLMESDKPYSDIEEKTGLPRMLCRLVDRLFEGLKNGEAKELPLRFVKAVKPGVDLSAISFEFLIWILGDSKNGVIKYARPDGKKAIKDIVEKLKDKLQGKAISSDEWFSLRRAARAAAYAADAADAAAAAYAAAAAAYAAAAAAAYAADAAYAAAAADAADAADAAAYAAAAAAYAAARTNHYKKMADRLIKLIEEAQ